MQVRLPITTFIAAALLCASTMASAYDPDWKRGRIYYRSVCTACHAAQAGGSIAPSTMTKAEWTAYLQKDKHAKGKDSVKQYVSKSYRASIRSQNKAADKFADLPDEELYRRPQGLRHQGRQGRRRAGQLQLNPHNQRIRIMKITHLGLLASLLFAGIVQAADAPAPTKLNTTADHSKFKELQREFTSGPEVTKACLTCHTEAALQIHRTKHWTWELLNPANKQRLGKKHVINNYCLSSGTNLGACATCHVGYGWAEFAASTSSRRKTSIAWSAMTPAAATRSSRAAAIRRSRIPRTRPDPARSSRRSISPKSPRRSARPAATPVAPATSSAVAATASSTATWTPRSLRRKRNWMSTWTPSALTSPAAPATRHPPMTSPAAVTRRPARTRTAHTSGARSNKSNPATCQSCHGQTPHKAGAQPAKLNQHTDKVACQTCHIPQFARGGVATKMNWDWSAAGKLSPEGKPMLKKDEHGHVIYDSRKGDFVVAENVTPEYAWFNGEVTYTLLGDKVDKATASR